MENASKALIMAAEILFGVILLTIFVIAFSAWQNMADGINENIELTKVQEFNSKFEVYMDKELTAYDIVTIVNMVNEFNYPDGYGNDYGNNKDDIEKIEIVPQKLPKEITDNTSNFIKDNNGKRYKITQIEYNEQTAKRFVKKMHIKEL